MCPTQKCCNSSLVFTIFTLLFTCSVFGGIRWKDNLVTLEAPPGATEIAFTFEGTAESHAGLVSAVLNVSCDCTTAKLDRENYASGDKVTLRVKYRIADTIGTQEKAVRVVTNDGHAEKLVFQVVVAERLLIAPRILLWEVNSLPLEQQVSIRSQGVEITQLIALGGSSSMFRAEVKRAEGVNQYKLIVSPLSTGTVAQDKIQLQATYANGNTEKLTVFAHVRLPFRQNGN
jgi:hypothetical protein